MSRLPKNNILGKALAECHGWLAQQCESPEWFAGEAGFTVQCPGKSKPQNV